MRKMTRSLGALTAAAGLLLSATVFAAGNNGANGTKLQCFDGMPDYPGTCSMSDGVATLDNSAGPYSGVYALNGNARGKTLSTVGQLSFTYTGTATAGSPRLSIPIDTDGDGVTDIYAFAGAYYCNDGAGFVDVLNDPTCTIFRNDDALVSYANWAAFAAAHPDYRIGPDGALTFLIADDTGVWTVSNVRLGKGG